MMIGSPKIEELAASMKAIVTFLTGEKAPPKVKDSSSDLPASPVPGSITASAQWCYCNVCGYHVPTWRYCNVCGYYVPTTSDFPPHAPHG